MPRIWQQNPNIYYSFPKFGRRSGIIGNDWKRQYTTTFRAKTVSPRIGPKAVILQCPVAIGDPYTTNFFAANAFNESDQGSWAQIIRAENESEDALNWTVTVEYSADVPEVENPLNRPAEVTWDFLPTEEIVDQDLSDPPKAIVNTAFDYFDPPLMRDERKPVVTIKRNEAQFSYDVAYAYQDATNSDTFLNVAPGYWKVGKYTTAGPSAQQILLDGTIITYWPVVYELMLNARGWIRTVLNQGMRQLKQDGSDWEPILQRGQPIAAPALLDSSGHVLKAGYPPIYLKFKTYPSLPFADLNFHGIDFGKGPIG